jgi:hypothetical protein
VNGFIFLFYALFVPEYVREVHWLITLAAILFVVALPAIHHSLRRVRKVATKVVVVLWGFAMVVIIVSDVLFASSFLSTLNHDLTYALGSAVFVICVLVIGVLTLKPIFYKWFGYLSIVTGIIGLATYLPPPIFPTPLLLFLLLSTLSLLLLGLWSLALGFNLRKLAK